MLQKILVILFIGLATTGRAQEAVPGEYVVLLKPQAQASSFMKSFEVESHEVVGLSIRLIRVADESLMSFPSMMDQLKNLPEVELVEPNYIYHLEAGVQQTGSSEILPNDPDFKKSWGIQNNGQPDGWGHPGRVGVDVGVARAWTIQRGNQGLIVATIDSGINYQHPDMRNNIWTNLAEANGRAGFDDDNNGFIDDIHGYDFVNSDGDPLDDHGHGTHVASIIGARGNNQFGMVGINWEVSLMPIKFASKEGKGTLELGIRAIQYATQMGAKIINNSWGGPGYSEILSRVVEEANKKNILFVAAAGNTGCDNDSEGPIYPASLKNENVISVAAFDQQGQLWNNSCYGATSVHFGAPGVEVWGLWGNDYRLKSGSSMAAPHVSGVAALLWANEPSLTVKEVKDRLLRTAKPLGTLSEKTITGATVDAYYALTNQIAPPDNNDPKNWRNKQSLNVSSAHPYENDFRREWEFTFAGAREISLFFENFELERREDRIALFDRKGQQLYVLTGKTGKGWSPIVPGDYVKVVFTTSPYTSFYGFDLTQAAYR